MNDITAIKRGLHDRAQNVAEHLLPKGRLQGHEWTVGSVRGEAGESLKVCVRGNKAGMWSDFAPGGEGGDLIDLWCAVKGLRLPQALDEIRAWLGIERPRFERHERTYRRPQIPAGSGKPAAAVRDYLTRQRMISPETLALYRIGERGRDIVFVSLVEGQPRFIKYLSVDRAPDGKKIVRVEPECEPVLFGWQAIDDNAREVTITEGEIDAMTSHDYGFPALSVPFGGGKGNKQRWIEAEFDRLQRFETIYLALDMDEEGEAAVLEIAGRLGRHRCRRVKLPHKDLNECRKRGVPAEDIRKCFEAASTLDPADLRRAGEFANEVVDLFWPKDGQEQGYQLPFERLRDKVVFRPAEMSIWTGPSGAGKSQLLSFASVDFVEQGAKVCIASLEMQAKRLLKRMVKQAANVDRPTEEFIHAVMRWLNEGVWLFDRTGKVKIAEVLEIFEYARCRYGCDTFVIDSLMRLGIGPDDYEGQERAVYEMVDWAVSKGVHLHLVAHARKTDAKFNGVPEIEDIKGTQEIGANAFNIVAVWRNRKLADEIKDLTEKAERGDLVAATELKEKLAIPSVIMNIAKQRNGDWEGKCGLWFNLQTYQYRSSRDDEHGKRYVNFSCIQENAA